MNEWNKDMFEKYQVKKIIIIIEYNHWYILILFFIFNYVIAHLQILVLYIIER